MKTIVLCILIIVLVIIIYIVYKKKRNLKEQIHGKYEEHEYKTYRNGDEKQYTKQTYETLFTLSYEDFEKTIAKTELAIYMKLIMEGKSAKEIGITDEQHKLMNTFMKSFNTGIKYMKYIDMNGFKQNTALLNTFNTKKDALSISTLVYYYRDSKRMPCKSHDAYLLKSPDSEEVAIKRTKAVKNNEEKYLDDIYGSYVDGTIDGIQDIKKTYDHIVYRYYKNTIQEDGPMFMNSQMDVLVGVFYALKLLRKGGSLTFSTLLIFLFPAVKEMIDKLVISFDHFTFESIKTHMFIHFSGYNGATPTMKLQTKTMESMYYRTKQYTCAYDSDYKIVSPKTQELLNAMDNALFKYYTEINLCCYNNDGETLTRLIHENIAFTLNYRTQNNLQVDHYMLSTVTEYYKEVYVSILSIDAPVTSGIVKYTEKPIKIDSSINYFYPDELGKKLMSCSKIDYENMGREDNRMKELYQDFTRGVSKYLSKKKGSTFSNAFVKLWEIYYKFGIIFSDVNSFHMCEAPGQWIKTTEYYINTHGKNNKYSWVANSLNPHNKQNIARFGEEIIDDKYGLLKKYKDKWLFGDDDTGDITISDNIRWYRKNVKNANLITGDAGLPYMDMPLMYLQKLDYSQAVIVLATCAKGGNCVVKCFTPYLKSRPESLQSTGFFVNLIYLYYYYFDLLYLYKPYSSNPYSGEFYIVGKNFLGIEDNILDDLLKVQDKFETNQTFIAQQDISNEFVYQVYNFLNNLIKLNINTLEKRAFLHKCIDDPDDIVGFKKLIEDKHISAIRERRFAMWVDMFNFQ